jgi:hypothetical protein
VEALLEQNQRQRESINLIRRYEVWQIRWVRNSLKFPIVKFISDLATIVTHRIVHVCAKIISTISPQNSLLFVKNIGENAIDEIFLSGSWTSWQRV